MKKLVVFYSLEGNTKIVAESIAEAVQGDLLEIKPVKEIGKSGKFRIFWGVKQVMFKEKPKLRPINKNIEDYDVIYLGSPVWAGTYTPPINTLLSKNAIKGKKVALFSCYGEQPATIFDNLKKALEGNTILGEIGFAEPLHKDTNECKKKAKEWALSLLNK